MSPSGNLSQLAATIHSRVSQIEDYMKKNDVAHATFDIDSPVDVQLPPPISGLREETLEALSELHELLLGPLPYLMRLMSPAVYLPSHLNSL